MAQKLQLDDQGIQTALQRMAEAGVENAAAGLSQMIGQHISMSVPRVTLVPLATVAERVGGPEAQVVGIYVAAEGDLTGHMMLIMGLDDAQRLINLLLGEVEDCVVGLNALGRSALAEVGNLTASFFLNAIASLLECTARPSPPAVIVDMAGAILDIMLVSAGELSDEILLLETLFESEGRQMTILFWVLPDLLTLESLLL